MLLPVWFHSSRTLFTRFDMAFNHASLVCLNSFKLSMKLVKLWIKALNLILSTLIDFEKGATVFATPR